MPGRLERIYSCRNGCSALGNLTNHRPRYSFHRADRRSDQRSLVIGPSIEKVCPQVGLTNVVADRQAVMDLRAHAMAYMFGFAVV